MATKPGDSDSRLAAISALLGARLAEWYWALIDHGYRLTSAVDDVRGASLQLRAARRTEHGGPWVKVKVEELWAPGPDPDGLGPRIAGFHLVRCSWNVQIGGTDATHTERLDVDRRKSPSHVRHRHPYGEPNHVRVPSTIATPRGWVAHLESIVAALYES